MPDTTSPLPVVRRLWPSDGPAVEAYFLRLDPETRAERFMAGLSDHAALAYARQALNREGLVFGAFVTGTLRALGELRPAGPYVPQILPALSLGSRAEVAFAVERGYRRNGLGQALFARLAAAARNRGVRDLEMRCLTRNRPMQRLATRAGASLRRVSDEAEGALHLALPTPASLWQESVTEAFDFGLALAAA